MSKEKVKAFPHKVIDSYSGKLEGQEQGMDLIDYFAAKAMQGCLAYSSVNPSKGNWQENSTPESLAEYSYEIADAILKEREKYKK